jgi:CMP-N-acetylneuraminic acid synthetase
MSLKDYIFVIPARKGSKGIKNKNIVKVNNKKLIEFTFKEIKKISSPKKYLISDSLEIKRIASKYEINTDYVRPKKLSKDNTDLIENLIHFDKFIKDKIKFKHYVILQPTSPLRSSKDIVNSIKKYNLEKADSLFSISKSIEHPSDTIFLKKNYFFYFKKEKNNLRQFYNDSFYINGAIYIFNRKLLNKKKIISKKHSLYKMPKVRSLDVNDLQDLELLKKILK